MRKLLVIAGLLSSSVLVQAEIVEFHILPGTGKLPWNSENQSIHARLGDTIRFYNDDSVVHTLHTFGAPCEHGSDISPGKFWDCHATKTYDPLNDDAIYDHNYGGKARVWIEVTEQ